MSNNNGNAAGKATRLAAAAATIIKGAMAGGPKGAAVGAVKAFLPEIIKLVIIILCVLILLPVLVIAAIPNILFGYNNSGSADIITLTEKAYSIDAAYREVQNYNQEAIDKIIAETKAKYTSEEGDPEYDDVKTDSYTDNTNIYWLIAITSVSHQQDLFTMNEESIKKMTVSKLIHTDSIITSILGEGDSAQIIKTLKIDIEDLDPDDLMKQLQFSDDEKNWAQVLYSTMAEDQHVGLGDTDGAGYYNTDYGHISFTDAATEVVYYNQTDSRWGNLMYGKSGTIGSSGCGPTALAMVIATLTENQVTPDEVADWAFKNGYRAEGNGSYHSLMVFGARHYGLTVEGIGKDADKLVEALKDGKLVIAIMSRGHFTSSGHFIVLRGITSDGKILVADPASYKRSNQEWRLSIITNEANRGAGSGGPFWVYSY